MGGIGRGRGGATQEDQLHLGNNSGRTSEEVDLGGEQTKMERSLQTPAHLHSGGSAGSDGAMLYTLPWRKYTLDC